MSSFARDTYAFEFAKVLIPKAGWHEAAEANITKVAAIAYALADAMETESKKNRTAGHDNLDRDT